MWGVEKGGIRMTSRTWAKPMKGLNWHEIRWGRLRFGEMRGVLAAL